MISREVYKLLVNVKEFGSYTKFIDLVSRVETSDILLSSKINYLLVC